MRMISELSLLTMVWFFLSHRTGTENLQHRSLDWQDRGQRWRHYSPPSIVGIGLEIQIFDVFWAIERINFCSRELVDVCERPSFGAHVWGHDGDRYMCKPHQTTSTYCQTGLDDKCLRIKSSNPFSFRTMSVRVAHAVAFSVSGLLDKGSTYGMHRRHINGSDLLYDFSHHLAAKHSIVLTLLSLKLASFFDETPERRRSPLEWTIRLVFKLGDIRLESGIFLGTHRRLYVSGSRFSTNPFRPR